DLKAAPHSRPPAKAAFSFVNKPQLPSETSWPKADMRVFLGKSASDQRRILVTKARIFSPVLIVFRAVDIRSRRAGRGVFANPIAATGIGPFSNGALKYL